MSLKDRKKIAVFICDAANEYQKRLINSIFSRATADGYYTVVYTFFSENADNYEYEKGERSITLLPTYDNFDGIIICFDTFSDSFIAADMYQRIKAKAKCPVVSIRRECADYSSVLINEDDSMRSVLNHLLADHEVKDFFFVNGPKDHPDAIKRLRCMQKVLRESNIELGEKDVFYGNFWRTQGEEIVDAIMERREGKLPEAIVCANDYMAISVCNELCARQIYVPDDVLVTGFDDIEEAASFLPSLTSVRIDVEKMASRAWNMLTSLMKNGNSRTARCENEYVSAYVVPRQSCGCQAETKYFLGQSAMKHYDVLMKQRLDGLQQSFMGMETGRNLDFESLSRLIAKYIFCNDGYRDFFLVLNDFDWENIDADTMHGFTEKMYVRTAIINNVLKKNTNITISPSDILPSELLPETPCGYYVVPVHYQDRSYGYAVISFYENGSVGYYLRYMMMNICNALEAIRNEKKINGLVDRLSKMYVTDAMTGLKNRHGFDEDSVALFSKSQREGRRMAIIGIDMDGLKSINDTFGHAEGDCAISTLAKAIEQAGDGAAQGYRVGGDEFQVLAMNYSEDDVRRFMDKVLSYLVSFNAQSKKPFNVRCSYGHAIVVPGSDKKLNEWMTLADNRMYEMKEKNRPTRQVIRR